MWVHTSVLQSCNCMFCIVKLQNSLQIMGLNNISKQVVFFCSTCSKPGTHPNQKLWNTKARCVCGQQLSVFLRCVLLWLLVLVIWVCWINRGWQEEKLLWLAVRPSQSVRYCFFILFYSDTNTLNIKKHHIWLWINKDTQELCSCACKYLKTATWL